MSIVRRRFMPILCSSLLWSLLCPLVSQGIAQDKVSPVPARTMPSWSSSQTDPSQTLSKPNLETLKLETVKVTETWPVVSQTKSDNGLESSLPAIENAENSFDVGYDSGIYFRIQQKKDSFELKTNVRSQVRFINFSNNEDFWTDSAGVTRPIEARRYFDVERLRIILSGHAFTPQLKYLIQMDGDTDSGNVVSVLDGWVGWKFSDTYEMQFGARKAPGTRNWMLGAFDTRMIDRSFANEFFRPSRTTGVWFVRDPSSRSHYEFMIGQGYNTEGLIPLGGLGDNFALSGTAWRDIVGSYGPARPTDFEYHDELAIRVGSSLTASIEGTPGRQLQETDFLRLTDGTRLTDPNALAPGATVDSFLVALLAVDAAFKYRGWSANSEYFLRSIDNVEANLPVPSVGLQYGFYVEGGTFIVPQKLEWNSQYAFVDGNQGATNSYATGFSYYPRSAQHLKLSIDATYIDGSPVNSTGSDIFVGDSGVLMRTQFQFVY